MPPELAASIARLRRHTRTRRWRKLAADGVFYGVLVLFAGWVIGQALDRAPPVTAHVQITSPVVPAGGKLAMRVEIDRHRLCQSRVAFRVYDGESKLTVVELPWTEAAGGIGPDKPFVRTITLPTDATPGDATLRIERSYRCPGNILHEIWPITETGRDLRFTILPRDGDDKHGHER